MSADHTHADWRDDWRGATLAVLVLGPIVALIFCLLTVIGVMLPNLFVALPLMLAGVDGLWLYVPSGLAAAWGAGIAWVFFWEEVIHG